MIARPEPLAYRKIYTFTSSYEYLHSSVDIIQHAAGQSAKS